MRSGAPLSLAIAIVIVDTLAVDRGKIRAYEVPPRLCAITQSRNVISNNVVEGYLKQYWFALSDSGQPVGGRRGIIKGTHDD